MQDGNTLQEKRLPPLKIYLQDVIVKAGTRSRREMSCILNLCTLQLFVFGQSPTANVSPCFVSVMTDPSYTRHTICRNSSLGHEEVHENLLQDVSTVWWCWWQRLSVSAYTDSHHILLLQQSWQQKTVFRAENGLDNDPFKFIFSNNALKSRSDSATQTTSSQQVCSTNRKEEICSRKRSHHKHCWSSHCSLGSLPQASMHLRCVLRMRGAGRVLGWGEDSQEVRRRKEEVTGLVGARGKIRTW